MDIAPHGYDCGQASSDMQPTEGIGKQGGIMGSENSSNEPPIEDGASYEVADRIVDCSHCGSKRFEKSTAQLNTAGLTFLGLDWANRNATILICARCGHIEWFLEED